MSRMFLSMVSRIYESPELLSTHFSASAAFSAFSA